MANRRMISSDLFEDEFIGELGFLERLLWIGLFSAVADDQGRLIDNPALIRAKVFLYDNKVDDECIEDSLRKLAAQNKIIRYEKSGKQLIQIVKWWIYQTPSWASPSKYPAPDDWTDREKYHIKENKIAIRNWDLSGGFSQLHNELPCQLPKQADCPLDSGIEERRGEEGEDDVKGDGDGERKADDNSPEELYKQNQEELAAQTQFSRLSQAFIEYSGLPELSGGAQRYTESIQKMVDAGITPEILAEAITQMRDKDYSIVSPGSCVNPALILLGKKRGKRAGSEEEDPRRFLKGKYGDVGFH